MSTDGSREGLNFSIKGGGQIKRKRTKRLTRPHSSSLHSGDEVGNMVLFGQVEPACDGDNFKHIHRLPRQELAEFSYPGLNQDGQGKSSHSGLCVCLM